MRSMKKKRFSSEIVTYRKLSRNKAWTMAGFFPIRPSRMDSQLCRCSRLDSSRSAIWMPLRLSAVKLSCLMDEMAFPAISCTYPLKSATWHTLSFISMSRES